MKHRKEIIITIITFSLILFLRYVNILQNENFLGAFFTVIILTLVSSYIINRINNQCIQNYKHKKINLDNIDIIRFLFSIIIIVLHVRPFLGTMDQLDLLFNNIISRICVPLFFITTGYFVAKKEVDQPEYIKKYIKATIPLYIVWSTIYILPALTWIAQFIPNINMTINSMSIPTIFLPFILVIGMIIAILIAVLYVGMYYHLWYFPALLFTLLIVRKWKKHLNIKILLVISFSLLLIGAIETYYGILPSAYQRVVSYYFTFFLTTRNFLFFGLFYVTLGYYMGSKASLYTPYSILKLIVCIFLLLTEALFLQTIERLNSNILLACIPLVYYLFVVLLYVNKIFKWQLKYSFRNLYKYYYLVHPLIILLVQSVLKDLLGYNAFMYRYEIVELLIIMTLTHLSSVAIISLKEKYKKLPF